MYVENVSNANELKEQIKEKDPNSRFTYQAVYYNESTKRYSFLAATVGSMKKIVLEDSGNNRLANVVISTEVNGSLVRVCTTNSAGVCYSAALFGNNTLVVADKNKNGAKRETTINYQDDTSSEYASFEAPQTAVFSLTATVDNVSVRITNTKDEVLCDGVVQDMSFACTSDKAMYNMTANIELSSDSI